MALNSVQIIALIAALFGLIKLLFIIISPKSWLGFAKGIWSKPRILGWVSFILACVILYFLLKEVTITQILAVMAFSWLLMAAGAVIFGSDLVKIANSVLNRINLRQYWWYFLIWLIIIIWALEEILL